MLMYTAIRVITLAMSGVAMYPISEGNPYMDDYRLPLMLSGQTQSLVPS